MSKLNEKKFYNVYFLYIAQIQISCKASLVIPFKNSCNYFYGIIVII